MTDDLQLLTDEQLHYEIARCDLCLRTLSQWSPKMDNVEALMQRLIVERDRRMSIFRNGNFPGAR